MTNLWPWEPLIKPDQHKADVLPLPSLDAYERLFIGFSGGLDSTVLLHRLAVSRYKGKLHAVHVNHGLSPNAADWELHCQKICLQLDLPLLQRRVSIKASSNIENEARNARYQVFAELLQQKNALLLAHHGDDQAETLLLQLFRGAGIEGMAAMPASRTLGQGHILRPLLAYSRRDLEKYAEAHKLTWINDESNGDCRFSRNFLRQQVIPLLQKRWPEVVSNLQRTVTHCQQAQNNLQALAAMDTPGKLQTNVLSIDLLLNLSPDRINNILRCWLMQNQVLCPSAATFKRLIEEVIFAANDAQPCVSWGIYQVRRYKQDLYLLKEAPLTQETLHWHDFPAKLVLNNNQCLEVISAEQGLIVTLGSNVQLRFRSGGESLAWHGQTQSLKKLFQQWQIPVWQRAQIPLVYMDGELAAVVGYAVSDHCYGEKKPGINPVTIIWGNDLSGTGCGSTKVRF